MFRWLIIAPIRLYQRLVSPMLGPRCRFYPSCSEYCVQAVRLRGVFRGVALGAWRVLRCHPLNPGGYNPVPGVNPAHDARRTRRRS